ncbi:MAG: ribosomal protein S18-alanine N-acetyltransferase [Gammaproteobacteria bacterium]|nr:ribosomal protein S18-alanine N-acetyltransferase [Gammaproteobacteria bacterium]MDH5591494.1 ribosomal protein S18-alanine N-acetyltransferase [Gammaproteobacteria bacterium]
MQKKDIADVITIEQSANQFPWTEKNFEDSLAAGHHAWVFCHDSDKIFGYTIVQSVIDEAHLLNICVSPADQGQGWGRKILNHVIDFSLSIPSSLIVLEVRGSNHRAQQLYLQSGFNEMSVRKDYYPAENGREDAILMGMDMTFLV